MGICGRIHTCVLFILDLMVLFLIPQTRIFWGCLHELNLFSMRGHLYWGARERKKWNSCLFSCQFSNVEAAAPILWALEVDPLGNNYVIKDEHLFLSLVSCRKSPESFYQKFTQPDSGAWWKKKKRKKKGKAETRCRMICC